MYQREEVQPAAQRATADTLKRAADEELPTENNAPKRAAGAVMGAGAGVATSTSNKASAGSSRAPGRVVPVAKHKVKKNDHNEAVAQRLVTAGVLLCRLNSAYTADVIRGFAYGCCGYTTVARYTGLLKRFQRHEAQSDAALAPVVLRILTKETTDKEDIVDLVNEAVGILDLVKEEQAIALRGYVVMIRNAV